MRDSRKPWLTRWRSAFVLVVMAGVGVCMPARAQETPRKLSVRRVKSLGRLPAKWPHLISLSADGEHLACVLERDGKSLVIYDGKEGPAYDEINVLQLSPDGRRLAYRARQGRKWLMVCDGREEPVYHTIEEYLVFSPDSKHLAYVARHDGLARDEKNPVYVEENDGKYFVVLDGKAGPLYDRSIGVPVFSPDSRRMAFTSATRTHYEDPNKQFVVLDGAKGPEYNEAVLNWSGGPGVQVFSPDSRRLAYYARRADKVFIVCDGKEGPAFDEMGMLLFSADSRHVVYVAKRKDKSFVVSDGKESGPCDNVGTPLFSPDGTRLAYVARRGNKWFVVCDGKEGPAYDDVPWQFIIRSVIFSPDSKHLVYVARREDKHRIVFDGREGPAYSGILTPFFSPDGTHFAYLGNRDRKWFVVCDGKEGPGHDEIHWASFSPDSRHLVCTVVTMPLRPVVSSLVCDGVQGPAGVLWPQPGGGGTPPWLAWVPEDTDKITGKFRCVLVEGMELWLVEADVPADLDWTHALEAVKP